jgi:hypothetical protein
LRIALIHSPFTGPNFWRPLAAVLPQALVIDYGGVSGPDWYDGAAGRICADADDRPWTAVLHSGAGGFAPSLAAHATHLKGVVFVDAVLPHPGRSAAEMAPPAQIDQLRGVTRDGLLAPWDRWFPPGLLQAWIPDDDARDAALADMPRVPFAFLEAPMPDDARWESLPSAFLQLSDGYARNAARAEGRGWPVARLASSHLGMVSEPDTVATALVTLQAAQASASNSRPQPRSD